MKRILGDGWFQAFTAISVLSAMVIAVQSARPRAEPLASLGTLPASVPIPLTDATAAAARVPVAAPAAVPGAAAAAPTATARVEAVTRGSPEDLVHAPGAGTADSPAMVRAPAGASLDGPARGGAAAPAARAGVFPVFRIAAKTRGRWVVANEPGPDVDSPSIARVIFSASDGDVVSIRPGLYAEALTVSRKTLTFRGLGARPEEVLLTAPDPTAVLRVDHGTVKLENLRIEPEKGYTATAAAVYATSANVSLKNVVARSQGAAVKAAQGQGDETSVTAVSSKLDGAYADVLVRGKARVYLRDDDFANERQPLVVWRDTRASVEACRFVKDAAARVYSYEDSTVDVSGSPSAPRVAAARADRDKSTDAAQFTVYTARPGAAAAQQGPTQWFKNIFRPGRKAGDIYQ